MANQKNIEPHKFKPGQSGNPNGRPPKLPDVEELLAHVLWQEVDGKSTALRILENICQIALKGKGATQLRAAEILMERAYGKPKQRADITLDAGRIISRYTLPDGTIIDL